MANRNKELQEALEAFIAMFEGGGSTGSEKNVALKNQYAKDPESVKLALGGAKNLVASLKKKAAGETGPIQRTAKVRSAAPPIPADAPRAKGTPPPIPADAPKAARPKGTPPPPPKKALESVMEDFRKYAGLPSVVESVESEEIEEEDFEE